MATNTVNFFQPGTEAAVDANAIARQRQIAEMLAQQGRTPQQGQMVSGHFVAPGAASYVAQLVSALGGAYAGRQADERERALGQSLAATRAKEVGDFITAGRGTPGQPARDIQPLTPNDDEGNAMPVAHADAVPAQAPDTARQMAIAMSSQNPMLQQAGGQMLTQQMADARRQSIMQSLGIGGGQPAPGGAPSAAGAAGAAPAAGSGFGGIDPRAIALMISGDPELAKLGGVMNDAAKPVPLREGDLVRPDANGNFRSVYSQPKLPAGMVPTRDAAGGVTGASVLPGFAAGNANIASTQAGAVEQAKDPYSPLVKVGDRMLTPAQARSEAQGTAQSAPVAPQPPMPTQPLPAGGPVNGERVPNPMAPRPGDTDRVAIYSQERNTIAQRLQAAAQSGDQAELRRAQQDAINLEKEIKSNKIPLPPMPVPGVAAPKQAGIQLPTEGQQKFETTVATESAQALLAGRDKAKSAADDLLSVGQARKAIQSGAFQGSGADTKLAIAKFVNSNIPGVNIDPEKVGNTDYLKSTLGNGVLAQAKALGANPSNADAERINEIVGSIGKDPQAMSRLLDWREAMGRRAIDNHNRTVGDAEARGMKSPYDLRVNVQQAVPATPGAAAGGGFKIIGVQ